MMHDSLSQRLTARFYEWEERGRGWHTFENSVELEPEFYPFFGHYASAPPIIDDGRRHTLFSGIISLFSGKKELAKNNDQMLTEIPPVQAYGYLSTEKLVAYSIVLPKAEKISVDDIEQLLLMLSYTEDPISFEIIATSASIGIQLACRANDEIHVYEQCKAYFPKAILTKSDTGLKILANDTKTCVIDFGLTEEFMRPLCMANDIDQDPYIGLFATLEHLLKGERGVIQILFKGAINPWAESIMRSVTDSKGGSFFEDAPDMVKFAQEKISAPLHFVCIKVAGQAQTSERAIEIAKNIGSALIRLTSSRGNRLQILPQNGYPLDDLIDDVYLRQSHRVGMLLNTGELATMVHFPTPEIASSKVERDTIPWSKKCHGLIGFDSDLMQSAYTINSNFVLLISLLFSSHNIRHTCLNLTKTKNRRIMRLLIPKQ